MLTLTLPALDESKNAVIDIPIPYSRTVDYCRFDGVAWLAVQSGSWGSLKQRAGAFAVKGGWQPRFLPHLKPWLRAGYNYGSGDGNVGDSTHGTFFQVLPTPRVYARFPFFNMMNNRDVFGDYRYNRLCNY